MNQAMDIRKRLAWLEPWFAAAISRAPDLSAAQARILQTIVSRWHEEHLFRLLDELDSRFPGEVDGLLEKVVACGVSEHWLRVAPLTHELSAADIVKLVWEPLAVSGFGVHADYCDGGAEVSCSSCPYAEMALRSGGRRWMYHLACAAERAAAGAFPEHILMTRADSLMQGRSECHFSLRDTPSRSQAVTTCAVPG